MTAMPTKKMLRSFSKEPIDVPKCIKIRNIPKRVLALTRLINVGSSTEATGAYIRALEGSVQLGTHSTTESEYDDVGIGEEGIPTQIVRPSCPESYLRCSSCILNITASDLNGVEPQSVMNALHKATTPHVPLVAVD